MSNAAAIRYRRKHNDVITVTAPRGTRDEWKEAAARAGLSLNKFIISAVREKVAAQNGLPRY